MNKEKIKIMLLKIIGWLLIPLALLIYIIYLIFKEMSDGFEKFYNKISYLNN